MLLLSLFSATGSEQGFKIQLLIGHTASDQDFNIWQKQVQVKNGQPYYNDTKDTSFGKF